MKIMYKLIVSIVPHNCGELITNAAKTVGANGGSILMGRGTAENSIIQLLGLGDTSKDIAYILVDDSICDSAMSSIQQASLGKKHFGVAFTVDVSDFLKSGSIGEQNKSEGTDPYVTKGENMVSDCSYEMINVILNKGYAEDAMAAARKAGAGGGTIISARGTAKEGDSKFFGIEIVPEKELLMILVPAEKKNDILKAISDLACFSKAGSGIIFCNPANNFTILGKK